MKRRLLFCYAISSFEYQNDISAAINKYPPWHFTFLARYHRSRTLHHRRWDYAFLSRCNLTAAITPLEDVINIHARRLEDIAGRDAANDQRLVLPRNNNSNPQSRARFHICYGRKSQSLHKSQRTVSRSRTRYRSQPLSRPHRARSRR